jgi:hypothetical protein
MLAVRFYSRLKKYVGIERIGDCERLYIGVKEISILNLPTYAISMIDCKSVGNVPLNRTLCPAVLLWKVFRNLACGEIKKGAPETCFALWALLHFLSNEAGGTHIYH